MTISATWWTATIITRWVLPDWTTDTAYQYERPRNTLCTVTVLEHQLPSKVATNTFTATQTFTDIDFNGTTTGGLKLKSLTTTQRDALWAPANGMLIYNSTTWEMNQYIGGAWSAVASGSTQANASTTVAGKVELATEAEWIAGTATWGTGASLDLTPDLIAKITQSASRVYCASTTGSDTYLASLTPALTAYTTGMLLPCKFTTTNTGACSININSLGAKSIKTLDGNDPQTGVIIANGVALLQYDWTNFVIHASDFATTSNKWVIEIATDAEVITGTDTARAVTPAQVWFTVIPDSITTYTALLQSADTERTTLTTDTSYVKLKEIVATFAWTYTIYFELAEINSLGGINAFGRIYKNGVAFWTEQTHSDSTYTSKVENLTFAAGDLIQLYAKTANLSGTKVRNMRIYWFIKPLLLTLTVNTN